MGKVKMVHWITIGMVAGILAGYVFGPVMSNFKFIGDIFLNLIQMSIVVLVMGLIIEALGSIDFKELGRLAAKILALFATTTIGGAIVGVIWAFVLKPGVGVNLPGGLQGKGIAVNEGFTDLLKSVVPRNIVSAMASNSMLQVVFFSLMVGISVSMLRDRESGKGILQFAKNANEVILNLIKFCMKLAPLGVFALLADVVGKSGADILVPLAKYLLGLILASICVFIVYVLLAAIYCRVNPIKLAIKLIPMGMMAAVTTSSAISLPIKMADSENKLGVSKRISRLVNPIGMNMNSDGQALFIAMASITIAQFYNMHLQFYDILLVVFVATITTVGTFAVPGGGLVTLALVIQMLELPMEGLALVAGVDWFRAMIVTPLNVTDDAMVSMVIAKTEGELDYGIFEHEVTEA